MMIVSISWQGNVTICKADGREHVASVWKRGMHWPRLTLGQNGVLNGINVHESEVDLLFSIFAFFTLYLTYIVLTNISPPIWFTRKTPSTVADHKFLDRNYVPSPDLILLR